MKKQTYVYQDKSFPVELTTSGKIQQVSVGGKTFNVELLRNEGGQMEMLIDGQPVNAQVSLEQAKRWVTVNGQTVALTRTSAGRKHSAHATQSAGLLSAPMPGQVRAVQVAEGDPVTKGQTLVVIEAMKMEIKVAAPFDGKVKSLQVKVGQSVEREQTLAELVENAG